MVFVSVNKQLRDREFIYQQDIHHRDTQFLDKKNSYAMILQNIELRNCWTRRRSTQSIENSTIYAIFLDKN